MFFAEAKCRLLQNVMYVGCCKQTLGATPPNPCKINGCGKSEPTFTPSVDSAITYKRGLQSSVFYSCNKHRKNGRLYTFTQFAEYFADVIYPEYNDFSETNESPNQLYDRLPKANTLVPTLSLIHI